jgi:hypothetical protein
MKIFLKLLPIAIFILFIANNKLSAQAQWKYVGEVKFPAADSSVLQPHLIAVNQNGRLFAISTKVTNAKAHNAVYYADSSDNSLKKLIDYNNNGDSDTLTGNIGGIRGIAVLGNDLLITAGQPYQKTKPNTVASLYYYPNQDTTQVQKFGYGFAVSSGYGTYLDGFAVTKDSFAVAGMPYGNTGIRFFNLSYSVTTPARGSYVSPPSGPAEPGGPNTGGYDVIRDVATVPGGDYNNPETPFYTSRNSYSSTQTTGGIAIWNGGTQTSPGTYTGQRITDAASELVFDKNIPYGITVDKNKVLWVAGIDSTRRWVKGYTVTVNFAEPVYELPSKNSSSYADPNGAPFLAPCDVALSSDALTAYVADASQKTIYKFKFTNVTGVKDNANTVYDFKLNQNYPNPFNPSTVISYSLPKATSVKLTVTNLLGQEVAVLINSFQQAGSHTQIFKADNLASGVYYYTLKTESGSISKKMILTK